MEINFKRVHTVKDLILSAVILAAGIGLYFINIGLGVVIAACGLLMLLLYKGGYKREGEDIVLCLKAMDLDHSCRTSLKDYLDGKDVEPLVNPSVRGGIIRLEVYCNAEAAVAYAQIFDFSNYTYEAATPLVELRGPRASRLINKL